MKYLLILFLFLFSSTLCFSQSYSKKEFKKILSRIDKDTMMNIISLSDNEMEGDSYIYYTYTQYFKKRSIIKIELKMNDKSISLTETYYYDKDLNCIYCTIKKYKHGLQFYDFEVKCYSKDKVCFFIDGKEVFFNRREKENLLTAITEDLKFYKEKFKQ